MACRHCGYRNPGQQTDRCPNCDENPFSKERRPPPKLRRGAAKKRPPHSRIQHQK